MMEPKPCAQSIEPPGEAWGVRIEPLGGGGLGAVPLQWREGKMDRRWLKCEGNEEAPSVLVLRPSP